MYEKYILESEKTLFVIMYFQLFVKKLAHRTVCFLMICHMEKKKKENKVIWCYLSFKKGNE